MGNPSSVVSRRRSPRRRKQFNGRMVKGVFCFVLVVAFTALATALPFDPAPRIVCAAPWTQLSTGCYRFHESPMTQTEAKKFCEEEQEFPARLIEIDSAEENRAIIAEMHRQNSFSQKINFWLGITDRHSEGHWVSESTGKSVNFTDWKSGEPNNAGRFGSENCAFINELEGWNDVDCNGKPNNGWTRTAFCEKRDLGLQQKGASLTRIRAKVANEASAGTDCAVKLTLRNRDEPLTCQTMTLDSAGNSWERNQVEDFKEEDFREEFLPCKHFYPKPGKLQFQFSCSGHMKLASVELDFGSTSYSNLPGLKDFDWTQWTDTWHNLY